MPSVAIPCMRYRDAPAAIAWLCEAFGFQCQMVVPRDDGVIVHAQLVLNDGMIMLGSVSNDNEYGKHLAQPDQIGGRETQTVYLHVEDADRVCERARNAGAVILQEPFDTDYGSREFMCRDPEGHIWNIGTYDPWQPAQLAGQP